MAKYSCLVAALFFGFGTLNAQQDRGEPSYDDLLAQVKKADPKADFLKLRMAFTKTAAYDPYDDPFRTIPQEMNAALNKKEYDKAIELAEKTLKKRYVGSVLALRCAIDAILPLGTRQVSVAGGLRPSLPSALS